MLRFALPFLLAALPACETATTGGEPSLERRSAESIDPRLPVAVEVDSRPADASLAARIATLLAEARASANAFAAAEPGTRAAAAAAGAPQSESWIAAQLALAELERIRAPFTRAFAEIDELRSASARSGRAAPADVAALEAAAAELMGLANLQAGALDSIGALIAG